MQIFIIVIILIGLFGYGYLRWLRPWQLRWGATDHEVKQIKPVDEIVEKTEKITLSHYLGL